MARLPRVLQKIFGGSLSASGNVAQIGSTVTGTPIYSTDLSVIQGLSAYLSGYGAQVVNSTNSPVLQEDNAFRLLVTQQLAYLFQLGLPEWDSLTTYYAGSIAQDGAGNIYESKVDSNTGNALTNTTYWKKYDTTRTGTILLYASASVPDGYLGCDGSAVSRSTYATLFGIVGTSFGSGDGSTTFNLPDLRGRVPVGLGTGTGGGATAWTLGRSTGGETVTLDTTQIPGHTHTYNSPPTARNITGPGASGSDPQAPAVNGGPPYSPQDTGSTGGGQPHNNLQPSLGINYIIKT